MQLKDIQGDHIAEFSSQLLNPLIAPGGLEYDTSYALGRDGYRVEMTAELLKLVNAR
jgi:hypothetical protein